MIAIPRRQFLLASAAPFIVGCESLGPKIDAVIKDTVEYGRAIYNGLRSAWFQIQELPQVQALSTETKDAIVNAGRAVGSLLDELGLARGVAQAQPIVAKIVTYAQAALRALGTIPGLPGTVTSLIAAAQIVLPVLQSLVGLAVATLGQVQAATEAKTILVTAPVK